MSDIVEELRSRSTGLVLLSDPPQFQKDGLCQQAANEIERLRAANEKLRAEAFEQCAAMIDGFRIGLGGEQPALERIAEIIRHEAKCMLETDG